MSQDGDQSVTSVPRSTVLVDIDYDQVSDYINLQGLWATATTLPPDYYFGDLIEAVIEAAHPPEPRPAFPPGPHYLPLKIAILGPSFSGKHSLAKALQERYGIRPIELKPIITDAIKAVEKRMEPEDPKKRKQQEEQEPEVFMQVAEQLYAVKEDIPDTIKAEILRARLRGVFGDETKTLEELEPPSKGPKKKAEDTPKKNSHGIAILGYPTTLSEAKELERVLSGFIHPSDLPEPLSSVKLKEAALLITPSEKQPPQPELERSFFDIVFWLDGNLDNIILRSTQRRVDASGNVWNLTFNPPPDNLLAKVKVIDDPEHTPEKLTAKYREFEETQAEVYSWLQLFGYQSCQEKLLELVETDVGLKESVQKAVNKIEKVLKLKDENPGLSSTSARSRFSSTRLFASQTIELPQNIAISLNSTFEKMKNRYLSGVNSALKALPEVNMKASYLADAIKSDYKEFLSRSDTKQEQLTPFLQALNSLIASKPYIPSAEKQEIFEQIEEVSDQLWEIIAGRKDEAVLERQRVIDSTPYVGLYAEAMEVGRELMQAEALWMYTAVNVEKEFNASVLGKTPCEKLNLPVLSLNLKKRPESEYGSCTGAKSILSTLKTQLLETAPQEDDIQCFSSEMTRFEGRLNIILEKVCGVIDEIGKNEHETCEVLDDWIVDAVKWENDCVNEIVRARQLSKAKDAVNSHTAIKAFQLPNGSEVQTHLRYIQMSLSELQKHYESTKLNINAKLQSYFEDVLDKRAGAKTNLVLKFVQLNGPQVEELRLLLPYFYNLRTLELWKTRLGVEGARRLAPAFASLAHLEVLSMEDNELHSEGLQALAVSLNQLPKLQSLTLSANNIDSEGGKVLASLCKHHRRLQELCISENQLGPVGFQALVSGLLVCAGTLRVLELGYNYLHVQGGQHLLLLVSRLPALEKLVLAGNQLGEDLERELSRQARTVNFYF